MYIHHTLELICLSVAHKRENDIYTLQPTNQSSSSLVFLGKMPQACLRDPEKKYMSVHPENYQDLFTCPHLPTGASDQQN